MQVPEPVLFILKRLEENGWQAYVVGGCVRDIIIGREPEDWDITTSAKPQEVKQCFSRTIDTGIKHGTVTVMLAGVGYEVTTYRVEAAYLDSRRPSSVAFTQNIIEDLRRRDFTMNAIAYHPKRGYCDPFEGIQDSHAGIIRGVGQARERFAEDPLRILRALRFSVQLGFSIEEKTYEAILQTVQTIKHISAERIAQEMEKLLLSCHMERLPLLWESGLLPCLSPVLAKAMVKNGEETARLLQAAPRDRVLRFTLFLYPAGRDTADAFLKFLKIDTKTRRSVCLLVEQLGLCLPTAAYPMRKLMYAIGEVQVERLLCLSVLCGRPEAGQADRLYHQIIDAGDCITLKQLCLSGDELSKRGVSGKAVGQALKQLLDLVHQDPSRNLQEVLLEKLNQILDS